MPTIESLINVSQLARLLATPLDVVREIVDRGIVPGQMTVLGAPRFKASDVDRWIKDGCPGAEQLPEEVGADV